MSQRGNYIPEHKALKDGPDPLRQRPWYLRPKNYFKPWAIGLWAFLIGCIMMLSGC